MFYRFLDAGRFYPVAEVCPAAEIWHEIEVDWHESDHDGSRIPGRGWEEWPGEGHDRHGHF